MSRKLNYLSNLFAVLVIAVLTALFSGLASETAVSAAESDFDIRNGGFLYAYNGNDKVVEIPEGVTEINSGCFMNKDGIEEIILPKGLKTIESYAFYRCSVKKINFPDSLTDIESGAFCECFSLGKAAFGKNLVNIGDKAFYACTSMSGVSFGSKLKSIGDAAFEGCTSLKSVKLPKSLENIGSKAFYYCSALKSVSIPKKNSLFRVGAFAFLNTEWLKGLTYNADGLIVYRDIVFATNNKIGTLSIPSGIKIIAGGAFTANNYTEVIIPDSVISICDRAFYSSYKLKEITIPSSVKYIFDYAFDNSANLESASIPDGVEYLGYNAVGSEKIEASDITDGLCKKVYAACCNGKNVNLYLPIYDGDFGNYKEDCQKLFDRISSLYGFRVAISAYDYNNVTITTFTSSEYPEGVIICGISPRPFIKLKKAEAEIIGNVEKTVTVKKYSNAEIKKLDETIKNGESLILKIKSSAKQTDENFEKINKKLQKQNKAGVILNIADNCTLTVDGISYQSVPYVKSGYVSLYVSADNAKIYSYAVELINKLFKKAKSNAYSDSNHGSSFSNAKSVLSKADSMSDLSDAMKIYAIAVTKYFNCADTANSMNMVYSKKYAYSYEKEANDVVRMKKLLDGTAAGVCEDFARYEMLLFSQMGIENWFNLSYALNHGWSVVKVTNSEGKEMYVPFDYDIGPHPRLSGASYNASDEKQVNARYKIYLNGIPGAPEKKDFSNSDFK